ncbi:MAG: ATP-binding protein [Deltaproteobacteria bacterium]|nr:ATP-binding protein [Deltaproteobacteria bacterium]
MIRLYVPGMLRYRDLAVRVVAAACKLVGDEAERSGETDFDVQVISAFGEAFNNIAIHGYREGDAGEVVVELEVFSDRITVRIVDHGESYDISSVPQPELDMLPERGMGLFIIQSFMDEFSYHPGPPNVLSLTKYLKPSARQAGGTHAKVESAGETEAP